MDGNSFNKDIPDAESKKIIQHHFKLKKKTCACTITRQGLANHVKFVYKKKVVFVLGICGLLKN